MRHQVSGYRLGRTSGARLALRRNLIKQFFTHERIHTTKAKAAAIRGEAERLITIARNSAEASDAEKVHARRLVISKLGDNQVIDRLFEPFVSGRPDGLGLGLALAREVALAHGGNLRHVPQPSGARFELHIPWHAS